jgi:ankyrin repeat protein
MATAAVPLNSRIDPSAPPSPVVCLTLPYRPACIPTALSQNGWSVLKRAARQGSADIVRLLLSKGADPNVQVRGPAIPPPIRTSPLLIGQEFGAVAQQQSICFRVEITAGKSSCRPPIPAPHYHPPTTITTTTIGR